MIDLTGRRFGKLVVIKKADKKDRQKHLMWLCKCECGKEIIVVGYSLKNGNTKSCGWLKKLPKLPL